MAYEISEKDEAMAQRIVNAPIAVKIEVMRVMIENLAAAIMESEDRELIIQMLQRMDKRRNQR